MQQDETNTPPSETTSNTPILTELLENVKEENNTLSTKEINTSDDGINQQQQPILVNIKQEEEMNTNSSSSGTLSRTEEGINNNNNTGSPSESTQQQPLAQVNNNIKEEEKVEEIIKKFSLPNMFSTLLNSFNLMLANSGDFVYSGELSNIMALPGLELIITSNGNNPSSAEGDTDTQVPLVSKPIGLPIIYKEQANEIIKIAKKSPYGKGEETIYDDNVRKSYELEPNQFKITNSKWQAELSNLLNTKIKTGLGIDKYKKVECKLYKLLLYEEGGHFDYHKDSEKECKQTCTMVVILPSIYKGGSFKIRHNDSEIELDYTEKDSAITSYFISFYSDCDHAVMPLTSGYRTCLVYNIVVTTDDNNQDHLPIADSSKYTVQVREQLSNWLEHIKTTTTTTTTNTHKGPLIYTLEHEYTAESLVFGCENLKGNDYKIYKCLESTKLPLLIFPAFLSLKVNEGFSDDDFFVEGSFWSISKMFFNQHSISSNLALEETQLFQGKSLKPADMKLLKKSEYQTGNYGTQSSKWYQKTCLVILSDNLPSIISMGFDFGLLYFRLLCKQSSGEGIIINGDLDNSNNDENIKLFFELYTNSWWKEPQEYRAAESKHDKFLKLLLELNQKELIKTFLSFKSNSSMVSVSVLSTILSTYGYPEFRKNFLGHLFDFLQREYTHMNSLKAYLEAFDVYYNVEDLEIIAERLSSYIQQPDQLYQFYLFCEKKRESSSSSMTTTNCYSLNKELFIPTIKRISKKLPKTREDYNLDTIGKYLLLLEKLMSREVVQDVLWFFFINDLPKALALIQQYGYNETFDPAVVFASLKTTKYYFDNYNNQLLLAQPIEENEELKLFFSGFRKYIIHNNLSAKNQDELLQLFQHSYDAAESEGALYVLKQFEENYTKNMAMIVHILDECFVKSFKPQLVVDDKLLQQFVEIAEKCVKYIEQCISTKNCIPLSFELDLKLNCDCELCTPIQQFIKGNKERFETPTAYSYSNICHIEKILKKFASDLVCNMRQTKKTIDKCCNSHESKTRNMKVLKNALENMRELLTFLIVYRSDKLSIPSFEFTGLLKCGPVGIEREKKEQEEIERAIQERLAKEEEQKKKKEQEKKQKEEEKKRKLEEKEQQKRKKLEENELKRKKDQELQEEKKKRKLEQEEKKKMQSSFSIKSSTPPVQVSIQPRPPQPPPSQQPSPRIPPPSQTATPTTIMSPMFAYQCGNAYSVMIGMPLNPQSFTTAASLTPSLLNFNTNLRQLNILNCTPQLLSQYEPTAINWAPTQLGPDFTNFFMNCVSQGFCVVAQCNDHQFFVLIPIQRFFPSNDFRFISIIVDVNGFNNLVLPIPTTTTQQSSSGQLSLNLEL